MNIIRVKASSPTQTKVKKNKTKTNDVEIRFNVELLTSQKSKINK